MTCDRNVLVDTLQDEAHQQDEDEVAEAFEDGGKVLVIVGDPHQFGKPHIQGDDGEGDESGHHSYIIELALHR